MQIVAKVQEVVARLPDTLSICLLEVLDVGGEDAIGNDLRPKIKSTCIGLHWFVLVCVGLVWLGFRFGFGLLFFSGLGALVLVWLVWDWVGLSWFGLVSLVGLSLGLVCSSPKSTDQNMPAVSDTDQVTSTSINPALNMPVQ